MARRPGRRSRPSSRGPRSPTSAASSSPTRPPPASPPWRPGGAVGRGSSSPASRRCSSTRSRPATCRPSRARLRSGARLHQDALLRELFDLGYVPVPEVAGRGEFARRGGIVDVFPPSLPLPIRIEFFGDEIDSLRAFDPTDQRTVAHGRRGRAPAGDRVPAPVGWRRGDPRAAGPGRRPAPRAARRGPRAVRGRADGRPRRPTRGPRARRAPCRSAMPPRSGPPSWRRRPVSTTSAGHARSCSTSRATSPRPPSSSGARPTSAGPS